MPLLETGSSCIIIIAWPAAAFLLRFFGHPAPRTQTHNTKAEFSPSGSSLFSGSLIFIQTPGGKHLDFNREEDVALFYVLQPDSYFLRLIYGNWFDLVLCWNVLSQKSDAGCFCCAHGAACRRRKPGAEWKESASKLLRCTCFKLLCMRYEVQKQNTLRVSFNPGQPEQL